MMKRAVETPPSSRARSRTTGVVYLLYFLTAIFAEFLNGRKLAAFSDAVNLIAFGFYAATSILFFYLFKPVNRRISLIAAICSILGCIVGALGIFSIFHFQFSPLIFFGPYCLLIGYLIFRSIFLPRILGVLMILAGLGWLVYLTPLAKYLTFSIEVIGILAEGLLMLWLVVMGVNVQRWKEQAGATKIQGGGNSY